MVMARSTPESHAAMTDFGFDTTRAASAPPHAKRNTLPQVRIFGNESLRSDGSAHAVLQLIPSPGKTNSQHSASSDVKVPAALSSMARLIRRASRLRTDQLHDGQRRPEALANLDINRTEQRLPATQADANAAAIRPPAQRDVHDIARDYPASRANYVRVVINGEMGIYVNQQPVDDFAGQWWQHGPVW
jgi:hypothetical protein